MESFFIKSDLQQVYAAFHEPLGSTIRSTGVIIFPPFGQEYIRTHKTLFVLAERLSQHSYPTMRFDPLGCGDSSGDLENVRLDDWLQNMQKVITEFRSAISPDRIVLIGVRTGASITALYLEKNKDSNIDLVHWFPVKDGKQYLQELSALQHTWLSGSFSSIQKHLNNEYLGFTYSTELLEDISSISIDLPEGMNLDLIRNRELSWSSVDELCMEEKGFWTKGTDDVNKSIVPYNDIEKIVSWISEEYT